jgi:hypothetical protein
VLAFAGALWSSAAFASDPLAEQLFVEAKSLMQQGKIEEACAKFRASHKLDPTATGTLLNLALCHEQLGKNASAWSEFRAVSGESAGRRQDRVDLAKEHAAKLEPLLAHATFFVPAEAKVHGLTLKLDDDEPIESAAWGTRVPVDPGKHVLEISAPGKITAKRTFVVASGPNDQDVVVTPLTDAPHTVSITTEDADALRTRRMIGFAVGGVGIGAVAVATIFGITAIGKNNDAVDRCPSDHCKSQKDVSSSTSDLSSSKSSATVSTILFFAGGAAVAGGLALVILSRPKNLESAMRVDMRLNVHAGGLSLSGAW